MNSTGVVAALAAEARTLGAAHRAAVRQAERLGRVTRVNAGTLLAVSGIGKPAARAAALALVEAGASSLVSWGMAGGLDPSLVAGTICLPMTVITEQGERFASELHRREALSAAVAAHFPIHSGTLLTAARALDSVSAKAVAFRTSGAVAVDMESAEVARVAAEQGLPFIAVRVIVDTAHDALPPSVMTASRDGAVRLGRLVWELMRAPGDIPALIRLGVRYRAAKHALSGVAHSGALAPQALGESSSGRVL